MILKDEMAKELFEEASDIDIETAVQPSRNEGINTLIEDDVFSGSSRSLDVKYIENTKVLAKSKTMERTHGGRLSAQQHGLSSHIPKVAGRISPNQVAKNMTTYQADQMTSDAGKTEQTEWRHALHDSKEMSTILRNEPK